MSGRTMARAAHLLVLGLAFVAGAGPAGRLSNLRGVPIEEMWLELVSTTGGEFRAIDWAATDSTGHFAFGPIRTARPPGSSGAPIAPAVTRGGTVALYDPRGLLGVNLLDSRGRVIRGADQGRSGGDPLRWLLGPELWRKLPNGHFVLAVQGRSGERVVPLTTLGGEPHIRAGARGRWSVTAVSTGVPADSTWLLLVGSSLISPRKPARPMFVPPIPLTDRDTVLEVRVNQLPWQINTPSVVFLSSAPGEWVIPLDSAFLNDGYVMVRHGDSLRYADSLAVSRPETEDGILSVGATSGDLSRDTVYDAEHFLHVVMGVDGDPDMLREEYGPFAYDAAGYYPGPNVATVGVSRYDCRRMQRYVPYFHPSTGLVFGGTREERVATVVAFLAADSTDTTTYVAPAYVCTHFARDVVRGAVRSGIPMYMVSAMPADGESHAFCAVLVGDSIDELDHWLFVEPQDDNFMPEGEPVDEYFARLSYFHIALVDPDNPSMTMVTVAQGTADSIRVVAEPFAAIGVTMPRVRPARGGH